MAKFMVDVLEVHTAFVHVEADSQEEAVEKVSEMLEDGEEYPEAEYSYTLESDAWTVIKLSNDS